MSSFKIIEGRAGERIAAFFLQKNGYQILDKNFRQRNGEIDIVALEKESQTLVFIEVKTRRSNKFGRPIEAITPWKLKSLIRVAQYYKLTHAKLPEIMRIDAISIMLANDGKPVEIEHFKNISV